MRRPLRALASGVFCLFVASFLSQNVLPLVHLRDVDTRETQSRASGNPSTSQVSKAPGSSHHDSTSCPVCQILHATQPTEAQSADFPVILAHAVTLLPLEIEALDPRGPPLTGSSPRAPPQAL
jgi:hypothetical protein